MDTLGKASKDRVKDPSSELPILEIARDPYPHLRNASGCVLARDHESGSAEVYVGRANAYPKLLSDRARLKEALENIGANLTGKDNFAERVADSLSRARTILK